MKKRIFAVFAFAILRGTGFRRGDVCSRQDVERYEVDMLATTMASRCLTVILTSVLLFLLYLAGQVAQCKPRVIEAVPRNLWHYISYAN